MKQYTRQTAKLYFQHAAKYRGLVFVVLFFGSLATVFSMLVPLWYKRFFDILSGAVTPPDVTQALVATLLSIVGLQVSVRLVFRRITEIADNEFETRVMADLSNTAFAYLHKHSFAFFNDRFVGSLVKQVNSFSRAFEVIKDKILWNLLPMAIEIVIAAVVLFSRAAWLGWILLAWLALFLGINGAMTKYKLQHDIRRVLSDFHLRVAPREKIALVGPSGAGKSTIVKLLLRQYDVTAGAVTIDGQPTNRMTQESLWDNISLVPQDPILFHRTLMENIRYGKPDATDEDVVAAAKLAHCHEFISEFPEGYDTYVGERGVKLSGGERQRVAIARAILRKAPILVLDEATSSLDSESERLIQEALTNLMKGKTVIVIAHRLSTIMKMDRIVVVDKGKIVEEGRHADLLKKDGGLYKKLWELQAGGFIGAAIGAA